MKKVSVLMWILSEKTIQALSRGDKMYVWGEKYTYCIFEDKVSLGIYITVSML